MKRFCRLRPPRACCPARYRDIGFAARHYHLERHAGDAPRHLGFVAADSTGDDAAGLNGIALEHAVTFLVAGAYGHNRLREWALGGVTRDLLTRPARCALLSH